MSLRIAINKEKRCTHTELTLPDGQVAVKVNGLFVEAPHLFTNVENQFANLLPEA
jgi:sulfur carrier protein ThiS